MGQRIAVIGGGIAGASVAYHLANRTDAPVTVFERGAIGAETTAKSTAVFRLLGEPPLVSMKRDGLALYNRFLAEPRATPSFELVGRLEVATTDAGAARLADRAAEHATATYLDGESLPETVLLPELATGPVAGALFDANVGVFRPVELVHEFVERARERGVEFRTNAAVTGIETDGGGVAAIRTDAARVPASHAVAAAGPWNVEVGRLAGTELPIRHTLAPILRLEPPTYLPHTLPSLRHVESGYYLVGGTDGSILVGHTPGGYAEAGTELDPDSVPDSVPEGIVSGAIDALGTLLPSLLNADLVEEWVGVRSLTPDGLPLAGPTSLGGFSVVAFNSEGIQLAPAAGEVVASRVAGTDLPDYASAVSPTRFRDGGGAISEAGGEGA